MIKNRITRIGFVLLILQFINPLLFSQIFPFQVGEWKKEKYGYLDYDLNVIIPPKYIEAGSLENGYALVKINESESAVIDSQGNELFTFTDESSYLSQIYEGVFSFKKDGLEGLMNVDGEVIEYGYESISPYINGIAIATFRDEEKSYYIDSHKKKMFKSFFLFDPPFNAAGFFNNEIAMVYVEKDGIKQWGLINEQGRYIVNPGNFFMGNRSFNSHGLILDRVDLYGKFGFHSRNGEWIIPPIYYDAYWYSGKVIAVMYKKPEYDMIYPNWQLIDEYGNIIRVLDENIEIRSNFYDGLAAFKRTDGWLYGFIDESGDIAIKEAYSVIYSGFKDGYAEVEYQGDIGLIDKEGFFTSLKEILE